MPAVVAVIAGGSFVVLLSFLVDLRRVVPVEDPAALLIPISVPFAPSRDERLRVELVTLPGLSRSALAVPDAAGVRV
ncbi:MAG TPA: hypothetical protein VF054_00960 [Micromonosporaceae bacterium]